MWKDGYLIIKIKRVWVKREKTLGENSDRATLQNYRGNVFIIKTIEK